ncbi:unnamed protein product [Symbiodinium necroappetens]|uniref:Uncharacterized protein n=1 Tax=Symbiodinium necroappetens TaxID=1628268 RepID=A0A812UUI8_9DINO|nr:unnamed protein product [Symbiodinium necroappetens]
MNDMLQKVSHFLKHSWLQYEDCVPSMLTATLHINDSSAVSGHLATFIGETQAMWSNEAFIEEAHMAVGAFEWHSPGEGSTEIGTGRGRLAMSAYAPRSHDEETLRQPQALRRATHQRDLGLTALLIILTSWGDVTYVHGLVKGLPAVGFAPPYGVFPAQVAEPISLEDVLGDWQTVACRNLCRSKCNRALHSSPFLGHLEHTVECRRIRPSRPRVFRHLSQPER